MEAATEHFGISATKTTVSDLAKTFGFQNLYIQFFDSKQAIGEAILCCANRLARISVVVYDAIADAPTASS